MTTPTKEPSTLYTGDTWNWIRTLIDYPSSAGWVLKYALSNSTVRINLAAVPAGDSHAINVAAATTNAYTAGTYVWVAFVEKDGARHTVDRGVLKVLKGLIDDATTGVELRSQAQIAHEAAKTALAEYTATNGAVSEYEINGRKVKYSSVQQLVELVNYWAREVIKEQRASGGKPRAGRLVTRFGQ